MPKTPHGKAVSDTEKQSPMGSTKNSKVTVSRIPVSLITGFLGIAMCPWKLLATPDAYIVG